MEIKVIGKAHSIPYSVALPLEWGSNNYYSIMQGVQLQPYPLHRAGSWCGWSHGSDPDPGPLPDPLC